jgi:hypothetical protein
MGEMCRLKVVLVFLDMIDKVAVLYFATALIAVVRIECVMVLPTIRANGIELARNEDAPDQAKKQRDAKDHDNDGQQFAGGADDGNISETGGSDSRDSKVQGIKVSSDILVDWRLLKIDER